MLNYLQRRPLVNKGVDESSSVLRLCSLQRLVIFAVLATDAAVHAVNTIHGNPKDNFVNESAEC